MAMRVISGVLMPASDKMQSGRATVQFVDHSWTGDVRGQAAHVQREVGPAGRYTSDPCFIVSLRELTVSESGERPPRNSSGPFGFAIAHEDDTIRLNTTCTRDYLEVTWNNTDNSDSPSATREISYMVIGEV